MPNKRHDDKHYVGAFVFKQDKQMLLNMASDHNVHKSDVIKASLYKFNQLTEKEQSSIISKVID